MALNRQTYRVTARPSKRSSRMRSGNRVRTNKRANPGNGLEWGQPNWPDSSNALDLTYEYLDEWPSRHATLVALQNDTRYGNGTQTNMTNASGTFCLLSNGTTQVSYEGGVWQNGVA